MASVNKVILVGNLGADPDTRYLPSGDAVSNIRLATTDRFKDKTSGEMKELTETIKQNLAAIEASGWTLNDLDDMRNEAAAVVTNLYVIDGSEWDLNSLQDMRKEAESTAARLEDIEKAS